ncbi:MAG: hypothetical protein M0R17_05205 [Candidatus Omnitrophica bacterium]|jgi:predicted PurR-regulated permease PerM|nr:hypothetical protein [Candidatus Omnitrophota bacterium]
MNFIKRLFKQVISKIVDIFKDLFNNFESVIILTLSGIGLTTLLVQVPFMITLPLWIEASMVIPVIAVLIITFLVTIMQWRTHGSYRYN